MATDEKTPIAIRANIALHFFDALIGRRKLPPETPEESHENAIAAQNLLKKMEDNARAGANNPRA
jgi:hypothetical protein